MTHMKPTSVPDEMDGIQQRQQTFESSTRKLYGSFAVQAIDDPGKMPTDLIFKHWKEAWEPIVTSDSDFKGDARELTERFLINASSNNLHYRTFIARRVSTQAIVGHIGCQVWDGPVPIQVVHPNAFSIGTMWGLYVERSLQNDYADSVSTALITEAKGYLLRHKCKKAVVLPLDDWDKTHFVNAGFLEGNMLTLPLKDKGFENQTTNEFLEIHHEGAASDNVVCSHWRKMWKEAGIPESGLVSEFDEVTHAFLQDARRRLGYQTVVARTTDGEIIGSVSCQIWEGPFPQIAKPAVFQYGTIWAVYVNPDRRRQGVATALMRSALTHLRGLGCDTAILVAASQAGQCVYERLGFAPNNALVCDLSEEQRTPLNSVELFDSPDPTICEELKKRLVSLGVTDLDPCILPALTTATHRQLVAVFEHTHPKRALVFQAVSDIQSKHGIHVDPTNNWFTKNVKRFGRGFDMKNLAANVSNLASKFDRLSAHYDHWTVGNLSKVESFVVKCSRTRLPEPVNTRDLRVLDVACGIGLQGQTLRLCGYQGGLVGTDISSGMIARVLTRGCYDHAYVANANDSLLPPSEVAADDRFDVVLCTGAMELLDQPRALASMASSLRPDGELWVSFQYDDISKESQVADTFMANPTSHQNVSGISRARAEQRLADAGFDVIVEAEICHDAFYTPSPEQDGTLLPVPYLFVVAKKS